MRLLSFAESVLLIRQEQIAHMKPGVINNLEPKDMPSAVLRAIEALFTLSEVSACRIPTRSALASLS